MRRLSLHSAARANRARGFGARGFTLVELAVTMLMLALLLKLASPSLVDFIRNARLREAGNTVMAALNFTRNEAIVRNAPVTLQSAADELIVVDGSGAVIRRDAMPDAVSVSFLQADGSPASPHQVSYGGAGRTLPLNTAVKVDLALAGASCGDELRCPRVMVRPGGALRLCKSQMDC